MNIENLVTQVAPVIYGDLSLSRLAIVEGQVERVGGLVGAVGRGPRGEALDGGLEAVVEAVLLGEQVAELAVDDWLGVDLLLH